ncbi:unnamed protein product [Symbiodinium natans]|uniref:Uncharacterized protein n=1 Tax=Symbiodinium natans TaxID=878477 RepID=A0A812PGB2_9DINO|nr:unnamed protein product [Symbiodinium natans]
MIVTEALPRRTGKTAARSLCHWAARILALISAAAVAGAVIPTRPAAAERAVVAATHVEVACFLTLGRGVGAAAAVQRTPMLLALAIGTVLTIAEVAVCRPIAKRTPASVWARWSRDWLRARTILVQLT